MLDERRGSWYNYKVKINASAKVGEKRYVYG